MRQTFRWVAQEAVAAVRGYFAPVAHPFDFWREFRRGWVACNIVLMPFWLLLLAHCVWSLLP